MEDYLVTIVRLEEEYGVARVTDIANELGVKLGTVTNTLSRLKVQGYIEHIPYRGVRLTEEGRRIALRVLRRHRLAERLLTDLLGVETHKVHEIAHRLEHDIADIEDYLERKLGDVRTCPHGKPIPPKEYRIEGIPLSEAKTGERYCIVKVIIDSDEVFEEIKKKGIKPGSFLIVKSEELDGGMKIKVDSKEILVSEKLLSAIIVHKVE